MGSEEGGVEAAVHEDLLGQEAPVDRPLEEEHATEVEGAPQVVDGVLQQEGEREEHLHRGADRQLHNRTWNVKQV